MARVMTQVMGQVLLLKLSSMGDVVHLLPALTDAKRARPELQFDWVVEQTFAPIARLHGAVRSAIPIELRRWRRAPLRSLPELLAFRRHLRAVHYDLVLDAQGLIKSAAIASMAHGACVGLDALSAREPLARLAYTRGVRVPRGLHAIARLRQLFAAALGYPLPESAPDFGITAPALPPTANARAGQYLLFLHGTSWATKLWPESAWRALCERAATAGWPVRMLYGDANEHARVQRILAGHVDAATLPPMDLQQLLPWLGNAAGVVSVDTGLGHLAAAFGVPTVMLYGATAARLTGAMGARSINLEADFLCAPCVAPRCAYVGALPVDDQGVSIAPACFASVPAARVWSALAGVLTNNLAQPVTA